MFKFFVQGRWLLWSIGGGILILVATSYQVYLDLQINGWFGTFYDSIQRVLAEPGSITLGEYFGLLLTFGQIAGVYVLVSVLLSFFAKHYVFRWRTSMNDYYVDNWQYARTIEGASQRVQEDARMFANIMQGLGVELLRSVATLVAFLPLLWGFSMHIGELPWVGQVDGELIYVVILFALAGTIGLAILGIKLPGLEYNNQVVEARYRKELVLGEDDPQRADPITARDLFGFVRQNYFRLFFHYLYFDVGKWSYLQFGVLVPYIAMGPAIVAGALTLGLMQQTARAFGRVESSFQYLVYSWATIVELISVWKRLTEFEKRVRQNRAKALLDEPTAQPEPGLLSPLVAGESTVRLGPSSGDLDPDPKDDPNPNPK